MSAWAIVMIVAGGLFAGAVANFAWDRLPIWRRMPLADFIPDFKHTIDLADKIQPALLVVAIASAAAFALTTDAQGRTLAAIAAGGFVLTLVASVAVLVPLQRRIISLRDPADEVETMRQRWFRGHLGRTGLSVASFALAAASTVV